jgi:Arc/MetJ family transcription regulator
VRDIYWRHLVTKRLVDIDDEVLEDARRALGTTTLKDTVNESLRRTVEAARRSTLTMDDIAAFAEAARDLGDPEVMAKAWE